MISVIISSANASLLADVKINIGNTIGVVHEILAFENHGGQMGMCEVYNLGAEQAKYDILCYMHEDVEMHTAGWGREVIRIFNENKNIGIIGLAGGVYKGRVPSGWFSNDFKPNLSRCNFIQAFKHSNQKPISVVSNPEGAQDFTRVVSVDGMWFCTLKSARDEYHFDQQTLKGFHGYDLDYCLGMQGKYDVVVSYNILMTHFSEGGYDRKWLNDIMNLHLKWGNILPLALVDLTDRELQVLEKLEYKRLILKLVNMDFSFFAIATFLSGLTKTSGLRKGLLMKMLYYAAQYLIRRPANV